MAEMAEIYGFFVRRPAGGNSGAPTSRKFRQLSASENGQCAVAAGQWRVDALRRAPGAEALLNGD
jgi:hypothetical protein